MGVRTGKPRGRPPKPKLKIEQVDLDGAMEALRRAMLGGDVSAAVAIIDRVCPKIRPMNALDEQMIKHRAEKHRYELAKLQAETMSLIDDKTDFSKLRKETLQAIAAAMKAHGL